MLPIPSSAIDKLCFMYKILHKITSGLCAWGIYETHTFYIWALILCQPMLALYHCDKIHRKEVKRRKGLLWLITSETSAQGYLFLGLWGDRTPQWTEYGAALPAVWWAGGRGSESETEGKREARDKIYSPSIYYQWPLPKTSIYLLVFYQIRNLSTIDWWHQIPFGLVISPKPYLWALCTGDWIFNTWVLGEISRCQP